MPYWWWGVIEGFEARTLSFIWNFFQALLLWAASVLSQCLTSARLLVPHPCGNPGGRGGRWSVLLGGPPVLTPDLAACCSVAGKHRSAPGHVSGVLRRPSGPHHCAGWRRRRGAVWCWQRGRLRDDLLGPRRADRRHHWAAVRVRTGEPGQLGQGSWAQRPSACGICSLAWLLATIFLSMFPLDLGRGKVGQLPPFYRGADGGSERNSESLALCPGP